MFSRRGIAPRRLRGPLGRRLIETDRGVGKRAEAAKHSDSCEFGFAQAFAKLESVGTTSQNAAMTNVDPDTIARTRPPAKLNLFLEVLRKREDGFHDIDTVMVPIDWRDELQLRRRQHPGIELSVDWIPSRHEVAAEFGLQPDSDAAKDLLAIPNDQNNLVYQALERFAAEFSVSGGFNCMLGKSIPAGAGMGGASSDAASALMCAAQLCDVAHDDDRLISIAAEIGSDVPFFMGCPSRPSPTMTAGRATGRGERIEPVELKSALDFIVVYPPIAVSTGQVYANCLVPHSPKTAGTLAEALRTGDNQAIESSLLNRLTPAAKKIAPQIGEILESMWHGGVRTCQLTGSGSACFAIISSSNEATTIEQQIRREMSGLRTLTSGDQQLGVRVRVAQSVSVPAEIELSKHR